MLLLVLSCCHQIDNVMTGSKAKLTTHKKVEALKPSLKDEWYTVGDGLRLLVKKNGSKYWRLKYRFNRKQKTLALGVFPEVGLKQAKEAATKARALVADGKDPSERNTSDENQFRFYASKWLDYQSSASASSWSESHKARVWRRLENGLLKKLGDWPINKVQKNDVRAQIEAIAEDGKHETAKRVAEDARRLFEYVTDQYSLDDQVDLRLLRVIKVPSPAVTHREALDLKNLNFFFQDLELYRTKGRELTVLAIKLLILTFVRSGELRGARWEEFDFDQKLWQIPAHRMKMKRPHEVPLSKQTLDVLARIKEITGDKELLFPSERRVDGVMSEETMRLAIYKMGYYPKSKDTKDGKVAPTYMRYESKSHYPDGREKEKAVPHGFRTMASSTLHESDQRFRSEAIERQLAHVEGNKVKAAYSHKAEYLDERREIMAWWGNIVDEKAYS